MQNICVLFTTKNFAKMKKSTLIKTIKAVINKNSALPILEDVNLVNDRLEVSDLETTVSMPFQSGIEVCIPSDKFITALEMMESPEFLSDKNFGVTIKEGKRAIKLTGENPESFPLAIENDFKQLNQIGNIGEVELGYMETALKFTSKDDLRPVMTGVFLGNDIASTDGHRLYFQPIEPMLDSFIMPAKSVKILLLIGGTWSIYSNGERVLFINDEGVMVYTRSIEGRYPDYPVVIPTGMGNVLLSAPLRGLMAEVKNAIKFSNKSTSLVKISLNGKVNISSQDVDFGYEYSTDLDDAKVVKREDLEIAFNGKFLNEMLAEQPTDKPVRIKMWAQNKAAIINDHFLLMPLMIENK